MMRRIAAAAVFVLIGTGATAFGCTNISTLNISDSSGRPGDQIQVTGSSFGNATPSGRRTQAPLPVRIRWNAAEGPTLAEAVPDAVGNISASITIPDASPGHYVIFGVQQDSDGYHMYGTPARIAFEVLTLDGRSVAPADLGADGLNDLPTSWKVPGLLAGLGVLGGALFVGGFVVSLRLLDPRRLGQPSRVGSTA